jgi:hypothetical protein
MDLFLPFPLAGPGRPRSFHLWISTSVDFLRRPSRRRIVDSVNVRSQAVIPVKAGGLTMTMVAE